MNRLFPAQETKVRRGISERANAVDPYEGKRWSRTLRVKFLASCVHSAPPAALAELVFALTASSGLLPAFERPV